MPRALVAGLGLMLASGSAVAAEKGAVFKGEPVFIELNGVSVASDPFRNVVLVDSYADEYALALPEARRWRVTTGTDLPFSAEADGYSVTLEFVPAGFDVLGQLAERGFREPDWIDIDDRAVLAWADPDGSDLHYWTTAPRASGHCLLHVVWTPPAEQSANDDALLDMLSRELDCRFDRAARDARSVVSRHDDAGLLRLIDDTARAAVGTLDTADGITAWLTVETADGRSSRELTAATSEQGLEQARREVRQLGQAATAYAVAYRGTYLREGRTLDVILVEGARRDTARGMLYAFPTRGRRELKLTGYFWQVAAVGSALESAHWNGP